MGYLSPFLLALRTRIASRHLRLTVNLLSDRGLTVDILLLSVAARTITALPS